MNGVVADTKRVQWVRAWPDDERPEFRIGRSGDDLIAEWVGFATLRSNRSGTRAEYRVDDPCASPEIVEKVGRGQVRALLGHLQGKLSFHGAAAAIDGNAFLILGGSGAGKSSTAAALCALGLADFVADDTAPVEIRDGSAWIDRVEADHWLPDDTARALGHGPSGSRFKQRLAPPSSTQKATRLITIVKLEFDDDLSHPSVRQLAGQEVFHALTTSMLRFVLDEAAVALRDFEQLTSLATIVPVFELKRPRGIESLEKNCTVILGLVENRARTGGAL